MKHLSQFISSSILLVFGFLVAALSLRGMHADAIYAAGTEINRPSQRSSGLDLSALTDAQMPGSVPYVALRGWERTEVLWLTDEERVQEYLQRVAARQESAELAWAEGKPELALTTYLKAYGYLHHVAHECFAAEVDIDCSAWRLAIIATAHGLESSVAVHSQTAGDDALRAQAAGLVSQIQSLRQQFQLD